MDGMVDLFVCEGCDDLLCVVKFGFQVLILLCCWMEKPHVK